MAKSKAQRYIEELDAPYTAAMAMHDLALFNLNNVAKSPLAGKPFWNGYRTHKDQPPAMPDGITIERRNEIIDARQEYAQAADDREWASTLALAQRHGVKATEVPAR